MFLNLLPIVYCGGGQFVVTLVHATDDDIQYTHKNCSYDSAYNCAELWYINLSCSLDSLLTIAIKQLKGMAHTMTKKS